MRTLNNVTDTCIHSCNPNKWDPCGSIMYKIMKGLVRFILKKLQRTDKICKLLNILVLTLKSQNDDDHEIHNLKKNPICILNFLHEHVPTVNEKNDFVAFH